jgi:hypothetical protein
VSGLLPLVGLRVLCVTVGDKTNTSHQAGIIRLRLRKLTSLDNNSV